ncbi:MAG TPA: hypothetical protein VE710_25025 [Candidatus Bathyarchaeia archaeon]|nr:hypothetical protein [Candidatus Bathyarchaeia archaeon]
MRGRASNRFWAGIIVFLMIFMQLFPLVAMAYDPPKYNAPQYKGTGVNAPTWDTPQIEAPQWEQPNLQSPDWGKLGSEPPKYQPPVLESPKSEINIQDPNIQAPDMNPPTVEPVQGEPVKGDPAKGEVNPGKSEPPVTGYDALKFSYKEVVGGTLGYTAGLIAQGEIDLQNGLKGKGLFLSGLGIKGLDLVFKDVPYLGTVTNLGVDAFDVISGYENFKFLLQQVPNSRIAGFANSYLPISNMDPPQMPGLFKGLNVAAAGISLVFDGIDAGKNFYEAFDPSLSEEEQNAKFVDGVGSTGSFLMDAAVIASVIPAAQPVAGALFVIGASLWVISKAVKYGDKLSGGAITRGVRNAVKKTFGWVKSIFA